MTAGPQNHSKIAAITLAMTALTACGGGGGTDSETAPEVSPPMSSANEFVPEAFSFRSQSSINIQYDAVNETITKFSRSGGTITVALASDQSAVGPTDFKLYDAEIVEDLPGGSFTRTYYLQGIRGETESGAGSVTLISAHPKFGGYNGMERYTNTDMPTTGSAVLSGDYIANFSAIRDVKEFTYIHGNAEINVDYASATVDGRISDRVDTAGNTFEDITLTQTALSAGRFTGETSGGAMIAPNHDIQFRHPYDGMIVGADGQEAVGGVAIRHTNTAADEQGWESGAFVVD